MNGTKTTKRDLYCFDPHVVDIAKLREDANKLVKGDYRTEPVDLVTIHHHKAGETCIGSTHETFVREEESDA